MNLFQEFFIGDRNVEKLNGRQQKQRLVVEENYYSFQVGRIKREGGIRFVQQQLEFQLVCLVEVGIMEERIYFERGFFGKAGRNFLIFFFSSFAVFCQCFLLVEFGWKLVDFEVGNCILQGVIFLKYRIEQRKGEKLV